MQQEFSPSPGRAACARMPQLHGVLVLNKPAGPSSAQCVARVKRALGQSRIGHAGTLDPMAQGVLVVLLGQATKLSGHLMGGKIYSGWLKLGETTDTWDKEGAVTAVAPIDGITPKQAQDAIFAWRGTTEQEVPAYSAAKHQGQPLYKLARQGKETPVKTKTVTIDRAELLACELPHVRFRVWCGSGTYIRSLAHSLGIRLGCGAVLTELTREYSHPFALDEAMELDQLLACPACAAQRVLPIDQALRHWPLLLLNAEQERRARNGMPLEYALVPPRDANRSLPPFAEGVNGLMVSRDGRPIALARSAYAGSQAVWTVERGLWL